MHYLKDVVFNRLAKIDKIKMFLYPLIKQTNVLKLLVTHFQYSYYHRCDERIL